MEKKLLPKLRFPIFRRTDEWQVKQLNQLLFEPKKRNRNLELGPADVLSVSGEHGCVNQIEFMGRSYAGVSVKDYHVVEHGDIVYTKSPLKKNPFGIIKENKGKRGIVSTLYAVYRPFADCSGTYLDHFFSGDFNLNSYLQPLVKKGAKNDMKVNNTDVLKGNICVPELLEQQKIADCLCSVDELIAVQSRKVEALKTHKKGLMQQLFPRDAETQPRWRFPEFRADNAWSVRKLGDIAENLDNKRVPITSSDRQAGSIPYYGASGIVDFVKDFIFDEDLLCVSEDGANLVARTYPIAFPISGKTWVNNHAHVLKFEQACTQKFVEIYLNSIKLDDFITGMAQPKLNKAMLDSIPVPHPGIPEQERIADCLTSLDNLIAAASQELETLKTHKKGLMLQLFPNMESSA